MSSARPLDPPSVIAAERLEALDRLLEGLDSVSLGFVAGYVTARARTPAGRLESTTRDAPQRRVTVLYASQTGNGRRLAEKLGRQAEDSGLPVRVLSCADYPVRELETEHVLILFISTHGDGDPPDDARGFLEFLASRRAPRLDHLAYGIFALGDSSYPKFCESGRVVDARLAELGARKFLTRAEADGEPQAVATGWLEEALVKSRSELGAWSRPPPTRLHVMHRSKSKSWPTRQSRAGGPRDRYVISNLRCRQVRCLISPVTHWVCGRTIRRKLLAESSTCWARPAANQ